MSSPASQRSHCRICRSGRGCMRAFVLAGIARQNLYVCSSSDMANFDSRAAVPFVTPAQGVSCRIGDIPRQVDGCCQIIFLVLRSKCEYVRGDQRIATSQFGPNNWGERGRQIFWLPANPHGASSSRLLLPYNPQQIAILPAIQVQSGCTGTIVG